MKPPRVVSQWFWGSPAAVRIASSAALGAALGMLLSGSSPWLAVLVLVMVFRTHLPSTALGWCGGWLAALVVRGRFEPIGKAILLGHEQAWRSLLAKPVLCYLDLTSARVMGSIPWALAAFSVALVGALSATIVFRRVRARRATSPHPTAPP